MKDKRGCSQWLLKILILLAAIWVLQKINLFPSLKNIFSSQPVAIDKTAQVIKQIKSLGQLITVVMYDEVVVDSSLKTTAFHLPGADKQLVIIARGKLLAGIDLKAMPDSSIKISGDSLSIHLPPAAILDIIINPGDYETFVERGEWSPEAVTNTKLKATLVITQHAYEKQILTKATTKATSVLKDFLHAAGFVEVTFLP